MEEKTKYGGGYTCNICGKYNRTSTLCQHDKLISNNMTPKEKAKELVDKMYYSRRYDNTESYIPQRAYNHAKQCALIAVNEIIESRKADPDFDDTKLGIVTHYIAPHPLRLSYWTKVKEEIEKL